MGGQRCEALPKSGQSLTNPSGFWRFAPFRLVLHQSHDFFLACDFNAQNTEVLTAVHGLRRTVFTMTTAGVLDRAPYVADWGTPSTA